MRSANSGVDRHEGLREPSAGIVPIVALYHVGCTAAIGRLYWLLSARYVGRPACASSVCVTLPVTRRRCADRDNTLSSGDVGQDIVAFSLAAVPGTEGQRRLEIFVVRVFLDHSITNGLSCVLCVLRTRNNAPFFVGNTGQMLYPIWR